jgi:sterol 3beta-glucosyltransferase
MKIAILTYGSRGDVQPLVALALGLQQAGHTVRLAAPHRFADFAAGHGLPFTPLPGDPEEMSARLNDARGNAIKAVRGMVDYVFSIAEPVARVAFAACAEADLIVHSFLFTTGAHSLAQARGIPDVSVQGFPMFAPTRAFPNVAVPNLPPGALSYFSHWLATQIYWRVGNQGFGRLRKNAPDVFAPFGGKHLELHWPFDHARGRSFNGSPPIQTPLLFAYSPVVLPRPADWTAPYIHVTGYFFLDAPEAYQPPEELERFLAAGDAPVCVTFGSMINRDAGRIEGIVRAALAQTEQRGVILTGWAPSRSAWGRSLPGSDLLYLDAAPHDYLLPRCRAVVHHGGAGTTAAGLRAGIPNIVIPHAVDQLFWGVRVAAIGAGPAPIEMEHLTVETLSAALKQADSAEIRAGAQRIGERIRAEDGIGRAVRIIEAQAVAHIA